MCGKRPLGKINIEMEPGYKKPVIEGQINGKKGYFLIDTGAEVSFLDIEKAWQYGYLISKNKPEKQFESILGELEIREVSKVRFFLKNAEIKAGFFATNLAMYLSRKGEEGHEEILGIIGSDIMKKYLFSLDFSNREITLSDKR